MIVKGRVRVYIMVISSIITDKVQLSTNRLRLEGEYEKFSKPFACLWLLTGTKFCYFKSKYCGRKKVSLKT